MGPREAAKACELLAVPRVVPMHWGTFPVLTGTPAALREEIAKRGVATEVIELAPGGSWPRQPSSLSVPVARAAASPAPTARTERVGIGAVGAALAAAREQPRYCSASRPANPSS